MLARVLIDPLLSFFYPAACAVCGENIDSFHNGLSCSTCWDQTIHFDGTETLCFKCGAYLSEKPPRGKTLCHQCDSYHFDKAVAVGLYQRSLSASIISLKSDPTISKKVEIAFLTRFRNCELQKPDLIIPVPISRKRRFERGYNQATILSELLGKYLSVPVIENKLERVLHTTTHRIGMDKKAREMSVKKVFACNAEFKDFEKILLVDDVLTTGATASACALELKKSGASVVNVFTLARAGLKYTK